jgi:hypothetical protein
MNKVEMDSVIYLLERMAARRCPRCTLGHTQACLEGDRCVHCMASLSSVRVSELPLQTVQTERGPITFRCESARLARRVCTVLARGWQ